MNKNNILKAPREEVVLLFNIKHFLYNYFEKRIYIVKKSNRKLLHDLCKTNGHNVLYVSDHYFALNNGKNLIFYYTPNFYWDEIPINRIEKQVWDNLQNECAVFENFDVNNPYFIRWRIENPSLIEKARKKKYPVLQKPLLTWFPHQFDINKHFDNEEHYNSIKHNFDRGYYYKPYIICINRFADFYEANLYRDVGRTEPPIIGNYYSGGFMQKILSFKGYFFLYINTVAGEYYGHIKTKFIRLEDVYLLFSLQPTTRTPNYLKSIYELSIFKTK